MKKATWLFSIMSAVLGGLWIYRFMEGKSGWAIILVLGFIALTIREYLSYSAGMKRRDEKIASFITEPEKWRVVNQPRPKWRGGHPPAANDD